MNVPNKEEQPAMTDPTTPTPPDEPKADETFTWTHPSPEPRATPGSAGATATSILESVRDAVDELAERATPSVRKFSARAAELAAIAADRAAPLAKRAGEVTADASGKLATRSRGWAADLRASMPSAATEAEPVEPASGSATDGGPVQTETEGPSEPD
jgi:hypothetical protein